MRKITVEEKALAVTIIPQQILSFPTSFEAAISRSTLINPGNRRI